MDLSEFVNKLEDIGEKVLNVLIGIGLIVLGLVGGWFLYASLVLSNISASSNLNINVSDSTNLIAAPFVDIGSFFSFVVGIILIIVACGIFYKVFLEPPKDQVTA